MARWNLEDEADVVIVGTGAGGATAARVLAAAGLSVVMLEEGPWLKASERRRELVGSMRQGARDVGAQATLGKAPIPVLQGRLVGGSTAINSGIIWHFPEDVLEDWRANHGLEELIREERLEGAYETIERELEITPTSDDLLGGNGGLMARACAELGLPGKAMTRNAARCKGRAECLQGCSSEARQSMDVSYVPRAVRDGARVHPLCRVTKLEIKGGRAVAVVGETLDPTTRRPNGAFRAVARRALIVAAGAIHTPVLLRQSGFRGVVGDRFQAHPGAAVLGRFDEPVVSGAGATQGYEVPMRARGYKLESISLPPEMLGARLPGAGPSWQRRLAEIDHYAAWAAQVRMQAHGRVRPMFGGRAGIRFDPLPSDFARTKEALLLICRMMFAAGAKEVLPGVASFPEVLTDVREVDALEGIDIGKEDLHLLASHLFGTACAGANPAKSAVDPTLRVHGVEGLYVMDASVFPTNLGVNPQHPIMALVYVAAEQLANRTRSSAAA